MLGWGRSGRIVLVICRWVRDRSSADLVCRCWSLCGVLCVAVHASRNFELLLCLTFAMAKVVCCSKLCYPTLSSNVNRGEIMIWLLFICCIVLFCVTESTVVGNCVNIQYSARVVSCWERRGIVPQANQSAFLFTSARTNECSSQCLLGVFENTPMNECCVMFYWPVLGNFVVRAFQHVANHRNFRLYIISADCKLLRQGSIFVSLLSK